MSYRPGYICVKWTLLSFAVIFLMLLQRPVCSYSVCYSAFLAIYFILYDLPDTFVIIPERETTQHIVLM
jgi:hypothetical protein